MFIDTGVAYVCDTNLGFAYQTYNFSYFGKNSKLVITNVKDEK